MLAGRLSKAQPRTKCWLVRRGWWLPGPQRAGRDLVCPVHCSDHRAHCKVITESSMQKELNNYMPGDCTDEQMDGILNTWLT